MTKVDRNNSVFFNLNKYQEHDILRKTVNFLSIKH